MEKSSKNAGCMRRSPAWMVGIKEIGEIGENVSRSTALQVQAAIMGCEALDAKLKQ